MNTLDEYVMSACKRKWSRIDSITSFVEKLDASIPKSVVHSAVHTLALRGDLLEKEVTAAGRVFKKWRKA